MSLIRVGVDASKGYADFCFQNEAGTFLAPSRRYDDTPAGHDAVRQATAQLAADHPSVRFRFGVECTGGLERNWLCLFAALPHPSEIYRLNQGLRPEYPIPAGTELKLPASAGLQ